MRFAPAADRNKNAILEVVKSYVSPGTRRALEIASGSGQHVAWFASALPSILWQPTEFCDASSRGGLAAFQESKASIDAHCESLSNVRAAIALDAAAPRWPVEGGTPDSTKEDTSRAAAVARNDAHGVLSEDASTSTNTGDAGIREEEAGGGGEGDSGKSKGVLLAPFDLVYSANMCHISPFPATEGLMRGAARVLRTGGHLLVYGPFKVGGQPTTDSNAQFDASLRMRDPSWGLRDVEVVQKLGLERGLLLVDMVDMPANNFTLVFQKS